MVRTLFLFCCLCLFYSCVKDKPNPLITSFPNTHHHGVWVLNEGVFGNANADLSFIDLTTGQAYNNLYHEVHGEHLGDIAQDIKKVNGKFWITVNNSNKILILDTATLQTIHEIHNISSPRYIELIHDTVVAVSSLHSKSVYLIHTSSYHIDTVTLDYPGSEQLLAIDSFLYVTNWHEKSNTLYCIDIKTHHITKRIPLQGYASHDIAVDANKRIWILSGNKFKHIPSHLQVLEKNNLTTVKHFTFPTDDEPLHLRFDASGTQLFFLKVNYNGQASSNGVYTMSTDALQLPTQPLIAANTNSYFYGLGIDAYSNTLFVSDANGFNQRSTVYRYAMNGQLIQNFMTGMGSNQFLTR